MKRLGSKLTYSNVISTICLFLLVGGGSAIAASQFGKETIGSRAIKKESIGPAKLTPAAKAALVGPTGKPARQVRPDRRALKATPARPGPLSALPASTKKA
jgi:hypothetical protein